MWGGVTPFSILRVYLTVTGDVCLKMSTCYSFCKLLPEDPTTHDNSNNSKEIQGVGSTLDFLKIY